MPRTSRKPFRRHLAQVEENIAVLKDGQWVPSWQVVRAPVYCLLMPAAVRRGIRYARDNESITIKAFFDEDPGLTTNHRLRHNDQLYYYRGGYDPTASGQMFVGYLELNSQDQPGRFMERAYLGIAGDMVEVTNMQARTALSGGMALVL